MDEYVKEHGFAGWFETSAKENINIDEAARALVNKVKRRFFSLAKYTSIITKSNFSYRYYLMIN